MLTQKYIFPEERVLKIAICHAWHQPYLIKAVPADVKTFIQSRIQSTPRQIFQDLQLRPDLQPGPVESRVTQAQVHNWWTRMCSSIWNTDADTYVSATNLLRGRNDLSGFFFEAAGIKAFGFYIENAVTELRLVVKEMSMDATYGTNNEGADFYAVLAEFGGAGIPVAYLMVTKSVSPNRIPGWLTLLLQQFLGGLQSRGMNPVFFGSDKDSAQLDAIKMTWPNATIQLCYWHVLRAVRAKLADTARTAPVPYHPLEAQSLVPEVEICWASQSLFRPSDHRYGSCDCPSKDRDFSQRLRIETSKQEAQAVVDMISRHFNSHSTIPNKYGQKREPLEIHRESTREAYRFCKDNDYPRLWVYLFQNWYHPAKWPLWSRASHPTMIPRLKTTMITESHWRLIKHDYLHRFARPRIDLVTFILISQVIPQTLARLTALKTANHRGGVASWRKKFKQDWRILEKKANDERFESGIGKLIPVMSVTKLTK